MKLKPLHTIIDTSQEVIGYQKEAQCGRTFFEAIFETAVFIILFAIIIPNLDLAQSAQMAEIKLFQPLKGTQCM